jgi:hypothetical protein
VQAQEMALTSGVPDEDGDFAFMPIELSDDPSQNQPTEYQSTNGASPSQNDASSCIGDGDVQSCCNAKNYRTENECCDCVTEALNQCVSCGSGNSGYRSGGCQCLEFSDGEDVSTENDGSSNSDGSGPQYDTETACVESCGLPPQDALNQDPSVRNCGPWCGCLSDDNGYVTVGGWYTCAQCSAEFLKRCESDIERERTINQNVDRLRQQRIKEATEEANAKLLALAQSSKKQAQQNFASSSKADVNKQLAAPQSCGQVARSAVDGCKQGVRAQVRYSAIMRNCMLSSIFHRFAKLRDL